MFKNQCFFKDDHVTMMLKLVWSIGPLFQSRNVFHLFESIFDQTFSGSTNASCDYVDNNEIREKYWGERPRGKWRLVVALKGVNRELAKMTKFKLGACSIPIIFSMRIFDLLYFLTISENGIIEQKKVIYGTTDSWPYMNRD